MRIKHYIVTYNNEEILNGCLESLSDVFKKYTKDEYQVYIINNHSNFKIDSKFNNRVEVLHNTLRPDFSTGHLARNWNQAILHGFKDLKNPDCDILITSQNDCYFKGDFIRNVKKWHETYSFLQQGAGDNYISYTPNAIKRVGLWDERYSNIGYQEADYFLRQLLYNKDGCSINDDVHLRLHNREKNNIIQLNESGFVRGDEFHLLSTKYHKVSEQVYKTKWGDTAKNHAVNGWSYDNLKHLSPTNSYTYYPYFELDISTLSEQNYIIPDEFKVNSHSENLTKYDIGNIILWKSNSELIKIIEDTFKDSIVLKTKISVKGEERINKINELYTPIIPQRDDERYFQTEDITVYLVKLPNKHKMMWRTEGYRLCNSVLLDFKNRYRNQFSYTDFHCSDNVTECNTAIKVFGIDYKTNLEIIDVDNLYHFIHGHSTTHEECYVYRDFKIEHISNSPVVEYLKGNKEAYFRQSHLFNVREETIHYHMGQYGEDRDSNSIKVAKVGDDYVVVDGMHRSSVCYFNGDRKILVRVVDYKSEPVAGQFLPHISEDDILSIRKKSHWNSLYKFLFELQNSQIRWVTIRGFRKMPWKPDTDLDIVVHPHDYDKFTNLMDKFVGDGLFTINHKHTKYNHPTKTLLYSAYSTVGLDGHHIPNTCFQLDVYNDLFFFKGNDGVQLNDGFIDELFKYVKVRSNLVVPHVHFELIMLLARIQIDKGGHWTDKHLTIRNEIKNDSDFNFDLLEKLFNYSMINSDFKLNLDL